MSFFPIHTMRGFIYMLEAVIAGLVLVGGMMAVSVQTFAAPPQKDYQSIAIAFLRGLDEQGRLRNLTVAKNVSALAAEFLYPSHNLTIQICDHTLSCTGSIPAGRNVYAGSYLIAGDTHFNPYMITVYLGEIL